MKWHRRRWCVTGDPVRTRGGGSPKIPNPIAAGHAAQSRDRSVRRRRQHPLGRRSESLGSAAEKLRSLLDSADERIALGAARAMLDLVPKLRADGDLADAVRDLERRVLATPQP